MLAASTMPGVIVPDLSFLWIETTRDVVIIIMGIAVAAFFAIGLVLMLVLGLLTRSLLQKTTGMIDENLKPMLDSAKQTADSARGTVSYIGESAAAPIVRTYGVVAGVRRAAGVIAGLTGAGGDKPRA
jgi:hypothetical protein